MTGLSASDPQLAEIELIEHAVDQLSTLLGPDWKVHRQAPADRQIDDIWIVSGPDGSSTALLIEAKKHLAPSEVERKVAPWLERQLRKQVTPTAALVVAPWLSHRAREVLDVEGLGYMDLTGNVSLRVADPTIVIQTQGAQRDPAPKPQVRRGISGAQAGRIVRQLVDFEPPRRVRELAAASALSESYASRVLETLDDEALIRRRGRVVWTVDWKNLLRARARSSSIMKVNHVVSAIARRGIEGTLDAVRVGSCPHDILMTGAMAAGHYAPLVVGGTLMLYVPTGPHVVDEVLKDLGLLRATAGTGTPTVQLFQPMNHGVFERPGPVVDGIPTVGLSQLVLDCLSGPGRLPAAGEALIEWMGSHTWREPSPIAEDDEKTPPGSNGS